MIITVLVKRVDPGAIRDDVGGVRGDHNGPGVRPPVDRWETQILDVPLVQPDSLFAWAVTSLMLLLASYCVG